MQHGLFYVWALSFYLMTSKVLLKHHNRQGRVRLSMKDAKPAAEAPAAE